MADDLEDHLNPGVVKKLILFFQDPEINRAGAVLVFSTHLASLFSMMDNPHAMNLAVNVDGVLHLQSLASLDLPRDIEPDEYLTSSRIPGSAPLYSSYIQLKRWFRHH